MWAAIIRPIPMTIGFNRRAIAFLTSFAIGVVLAISITDEEE